MTMPGPRLDRSLHTVAEQDVDRITSHDISNLHCDTVAHSPLVFSTVEEIVASLVREEGDTVFSWQYRGEYEHSQRRDEEVERTLYVPVLP